MKRKHIVVALGVVIVLLAVLGGCIYAVPQPAEPEYVVEASGSAFRDVTLSATTNITGDATTIAPFSILGRLYAAEWVDGDCAAGVDVTVTLTTRPSGIDRNVLILTNAANDALYYPREQVHGNTGTGLTLEGSEIAYDLPFLDGVPSITVSEGGQTKTCTCLLYYLAE